MKDWVDVAAKLGGDVVRVFSGVRYGQKAVPIDLPRIKAIIDKVGYRGFRPIEALGDGEPAVIVTQFLEKVRKAFLQS